NGVEIAGNTSMGCERGIYLHNAWNIDVHDNTSFDNSKAALMMISDDSRATMSNIKVEDNVFIAKKASQPVAWVRTMDNVFMPKPFTSNNNYWARPVDDDLTFDTFLNNTFTRRTFPEWQSLNNQDANSKS